MKKFMDRDFLLDNGTAKFLYENYAEKMPVFDYHCHLDAREIYEDKRFSTITEAALWLPASIIGRPQQIPVCWSIKV